MRPIEAQVEPGAARDTPLNAKLRIIRQLCTEKVNAQIIPAQDKGCIRALHGNIAVNTVRKLCAAVERELSAALPIDAKIGVQRTVQPLRQRHFRRTQRSKRNTIHRKMRRIGFPCRVNDTRTRNLPIADIRRKILKREHPVRIGDIRRRILKGNLVNCSRCSR